MTAKQRPDARYIDGVPHVVLFGAHDDKEEKCWILLWRQGKAFRISVDAVDVKDTAFYKDWRPLIQEDALNSFDQFEWLCDLIINTSMDLLRDLAPVQPHWQTVADYLHTPRYRVKLAAQATSRVVKSQVTEGPEEEPPYSLKPAQIDDLSVFAGSIPKFAADELEVLDADKNWRIRPSQIHTPDGQINYFLACERDIRRMPENVITNGAWDKIKALVELRKSVEQESFGWPSDVPAVTGIVLDGTLLAGILLAYKEENLLAKLARYQDI